MENQYFTGVLDDIRPAEARKKDWSIDEVLAGDAPMNWREKQESEIAKWPAWDQAGTSACVAFSKARQLSIRIFKETGVWIDFSPASIYQLRANRPGLGMMISDANDIVNSRGATLEALMKSQGLTEEQIMAVKRSKVADLIARAIAEAVVSYLYVAVDIDRIAQTIESGKAVSLLTFAAYDEYSRKEPMVMGQLTYEDAPIRHEIVAVDYFLAGGVKKLRINDSAHFGGFAERDFTADWLKNRVILADAMDLFSFEGSKEIRPKFRFEANLWQGMPVNEDTKNLQNMLKWEQSFPANQDSTGYYGPITAKAVLDWQLKNKVAPEEELKRLGGTKFGPASRAVANQKYS